MSKLTRISASAAALLFAVTGIASNPAPLTSNGTSNGAPRGDKTSLADWPVEQTSEPKANEWEQATPVSFTRAVGGRATACVASRLHEWLRVRCPALRVSAITQLGGDVEGTRFGIDPAGKDEVSLGGEVVLPLRPKQRRVILFWGLGPGYDGPLTVAARVVLQTEWSGSAPRVLLHDAVHEPVRTAQSERRAQEAAQQPPSESSTW